MNSVIDRNSSVPLNKQVENLIRKNISEGIWLPGSKIPSERKMCALYGISHITARSAVSTLVSEGLLYTSHGKGTYVSEPTVDVSSNAGVLNQIGINNVGFSYTELLSFEKKEAETDVCRLFGCQNNTLFYIFERISEIDGRRFGYHRSYIPEKLVQTISEKDVLKEHSGDILKRNGHYGDRVEESLEVIEANSKESQILGVSRKFPLYRLENSYYTADGEVMYYTVIKFSSKKIKLNFEVKYQG